MQKKSVGLQFPDMHSADFCDVQHFLAHNYLRKVPKLLPPFFFYTMTKQDSVILVVSSCYISPDHLPYVPILKFKLSLRMFTLRFRVHFMHHYLLTSYAFLFNFTVRCLWQRGTSGTGTNMVICLKRGRKRTKRRLHTAWLTRKRKERKKK